MSAFDSLSNGRHGNFAAAVLGDPLNETERAISKLYNNEMELADRIG